MATKSIYAQVDRQYKAFIKAWYALEDSNLQGDKSPADMKEAWAKFWDRWVVCSAKDFWRFVSLHMCINHKGVPVVYAMHDDHVLEGFEYREIKFEDLVANCWNLWKSDTATDADIEAKLRQAFEAGLRKAKKAHFDL